MQFTVFDCPTCGNLHPVFFDSQRCIDGAYVFTCPVAGTVDIDREEVRRGDLRTVVSVAAEQP